jgi:hypothetical protein
MQVNSDQDLEGIFIRMNSERLSTVKAMQNKGGLLNFRKGNILLVHIDYSRTPVMFAKSRRIFNHLAEFIEYVHGNVKCRLLGLFDFNKKYKNERFDDRGHDFIPKNKELLVPIYCCKFVSNSIKEIPLPYKEYFY